MKNYVAVLVKDPNDIGYSVHFPEVSGCFTCGDDMEDACGMATEALALMLEYQGENDDILEPQGIQWVASHIDWDLDTEETSYTLVRIPYIKGFIYNRKINK